MFTITPLPVEKDGRQFWRWTGRAIIFWCFFTTGANFVGINIGKKLDGRPRIIARPFIRAGGIPIPCNFPQKSSFGSKIQLLPFSTLPFARIFRFQTSIYYPNIIWVWLFQWYLSIPRCFKRSRKRVKTRIHFSSEWVSQIPFKPRIIYFTLRTDRFTQPERY